MAPDFITDLERRAKAKRLSIAEVCRRANVAPSTFARWKSGDSLPTIRVLRKIEDVIANDTGTDEIPDAPEAA
jgi:transcriptional regulator with XRE-family HTH domain